MGTIYKIYTIYKTIYKRTEERVTLMGTALVSSRNRKKIISSKVERQKGER